MQTPSTFDWAGCCMLLMLIIRLRYVYEREMASCPDAYFPVVIIIGDTSRVSNIYTKQVVQNTEDYFINQFSYIVYFTFFII
ncbi:MAG: hypothetical protein ACJASL_003249 [Paraglaciecola sp.]|jgi:hypothetical protein